MTDFSDPGHRPPGPGGPPPFGAPPGQPYGQPHYGPPPGQPYGPPQYGPPPGQPYGPPPEHPYSQPQYGPPGGPPPGFGQYGPPPGRSKTPWVVGGIVVAAVAATAIVLVVTLGGGSSGPSGPTAAVDKLLKADLRNDLAAAQAVTCDPLKSELSDKGDPDKSYQLGKTTQNGKSATVAVTIVDSDNQTGQVVFVVQQQGDNSWKVCDAQDGSSSSGGGSAGPAPDTSGGAATAFPSEAPTDFPTDLPSDGSSFCITPNGQSPICVP